MVSDDGMKKNFTAWINKHLEKEYFNSFKKLI
jgi:hypothetical protein